MTAPAQKIDIATLYGNHSGWLHHWLSRRTRCTHRAAELAQETFCRLLENGSREPLRDPRAYLATLAKRLLIDDIRRRDIERAVMAACALQGTNIETITPDRLAEAKQLLDLIGRVVDALPAQARSAFLLRRIDGMEHREIADTLGISLSTVKRHLALAYARCYAIAYVG